ncbi:MAG: glycoside hydrolase family 3 N-terminal domain-containing protein, partial [Myxococcota bacterium]
DLGFDGVVCTDDLVMKAVRDRVSVQEQADRVTRATVDLLLVGKEPERQVELFEALVRGQERNRGFETHSVVSEQRIHGLRERFWLPPEGARPPVDRFVLSDPGNRVLAERIRREG